MNSRFGEFIDRRNTHCVKWDSIEKRFGRDDVIPLWVADMDFATLPEIITSIKQRAEHGIFGYTQIPDELDRAIVNWMNKKGWKIKKDWIVYTPGVVTALNLAVCALTEPGDSVIIQPPVYPPFFSVAKNHKRHTLLNQLVYKDNQYYMDFFDLESKMASGAKMMILCSPHNPVGRVWTRDELNKLVELCLKYDVLLVSDEIHSDLIYPSYRHIAIASLSEDLAQHSVTCISPSKTFNVPGLMLSATIIPNDKLRRKFRTLIDQFAMNSINIFGIVAAQAAYSYGHEWLTELIDYLKGNLEYLKSFISDHIPQIEIVEPQGTYLVWLNFKKLGMDSKQLNNFLINKARIGLNNGAEFGPGGEGFMRMNIACPRSTLVEGLNRLKEAIEQI